MDVSGMGADGTAGCRNIIGNTGGLKLRGMWREIMQPLAVFKRLDGEFFEYGGILSKSRVWWHNTSNLC
jgi:hypothetical protein